MVTSSFLAFALPPSSEISRGVSGEKEVETVYKVPLARSPQLKPLGDSGYRLVSWPEVRELRKLRGRGLGEEE